MSKLKQNQIQKQRMRLSRDKTDKLRGRKMPVLSPRRKLTWSLGPRSAFLVTQDQLKAVTVCPDSILAHSFLVSQRVAEPGVGFSHPAAQAVVFPTHRCDLVSHWFLAYMPALVRHSPPPRLKRAHQTLVYDDKTKHLPFSVFQFPSMCLTHGLSELSQNSSNSFLWCFVNFT